MAQPDEGFEMDFDSELKGLFEEAKQVIESRAAASRPDAKAGAEGEPLSVALSFVSALRPMVMGIEAITRAAGENGFLLEKIEKSTASAAANQAALVGELRALIDSKNGVNQRMFDALHEELRGYKDGFLMESVQLPIIRDLISLYDDLSGIHRQMETALRESAQGDSLGTRISSLSRNLDHHLEFLLEVLARLEVLPTDCAAGKLDKRAQRAMALEAAESPEGDGDVVRVLKRGFQWRDRVLRPEEVVVKRWKEPVETAPVENSLPVG
jgi:molecular chaperone GrpE (heat shock protein)